MYNLFNVPCIPHREVDEEGSEEIIQRENLKGEGEGGRAGEVEGGREGGREGDREIGRGRGGREGE